MNQIAIEISNCAITYELKTRYKSGLIESFSAVIE